VIQQRLLRVAAGVVDEVGTCVRKRGRVRRSTGLPALTVTLRAEVCVLAVHVVVTAKRDQMQRMENNYVKTNVHIIPALHRLKAKGSLSCLSVPRDSRRIGWWSLFVVCRNDAKH